MLSAGIQRRQKSGDHALEFEFAAVCLAAVKEPIDVWTERYQTVLFLGYAPDVVHGQVVMDQDGKIEVTSNVKENPPLDTSQYVDETTGKDFEVVQIQDNQEEADPFAEVAEQQTYIPCYV